MFSKLLDITGFFVGVLINLLLIALICFYFKRKIDNLELSQSEQAKMLYGIISANSSNMSSNQNNVLESFTSEKTDSSYENNNYDLDNTLQSEEERASNNSEEDSDAESDSDYESDSEEVDEKSEVENVKMVDLDLISKPELVDIEPNIEKEVKADDSGILDISISEIDESEFFKKSVDISSSEEIDYEKKTVSELRTLLTSQGIVVKSSLKKAELIDKLNEVKFNEET